MEWWFATLGVACLAVSAIAMRHPLLSLVTLGLFMPLALHTLYHDFGRFWVLMALSFVVEVLAVARSLFTFAVREPSPEEGMAVAQEAVSA